MTAQMEQFCKRNNLSRATIDSVLHVIEESLAILSPPEGTQLSLAYSRADETMTWEVQCPHPIPDGIFEESPDNLAVTILRHFCRELRINGNTVSIMVAC